MTTVFAVAVVLSGMTLIVTRNLSASLHERWNRKYHWTRWATGPRVMQLSVVCNVLVGICLTTVGLVWLVAGPAIR